MTNDTKAMEGVVGPEDTSYEPSAEGEQERGQMTRHDIGKGWGIPPAEGKGTYYAMVAAMFRGHVATSRRCHIGRDYT